MPLSAPWYGRCKASVPDDCDLRLPDLRTADEQHGIPEKVWHAQVVTLGHI